MKQHTRVIPSGLAAALLIAAALYVTNGIPYPCDIRPCLELGLPEWVCVWWCVPGLAG